MIMDKEEVAATDAVEKVSSSIGIAAAGTECVDSVVSSKQVRGYRGQHGQSEGLVEMGAWVRCFV